MLPSIREAILAINRTDLSRASSTDVFLSSISSESDQRVVSVQSEMIAFCRHNVKSIDHKELASVAITNLDNLDFVGITEHAEQDLSCLFDRLSLGAPLAAIKSLNMSPAKRKIDINDPAIRRVFRKHTEADLQLYDHVVGRKLSWRMSDNAELGLKRSKPLSI